MKKIEKISLTLISLVIVLAIVSSCTSVRSTDVLVEGTPMPIDIVEDLPVKMKFVLSNVPVVQHVVQATLIIEPEIEVANTEIYILLPREFSLLKGNLQWKGNLSKNRSMRLNFSISAEKIGDYRLEAIAVVKSSGSYPKISSTRLYTSIVEREEDFKPVLPENITQIEVTDLGTNEKIPNENAAPSSPGTITVYGYWYYYDQNNNLKPCRYARVELWDGDFPTDVKLSTTYCQSNGYYQFPAINNDDGLLEYGYDVYVKVFCDSDLEVYVTDGSGGTYWAQTDKHDNAADGMHNMGNYAISGSNRGCFGLYDNVIDEYWWLYNRVSWSRSEVQVRFPVGSWPVSTGNRIDVPSGWEWDRMMALHEYAHCIHYAARGGSFPSGSGPDPHYIYSESSGGFAITEGWAEFMQCAVDNNGGYGFGTGQSIETNTWADFIDSGDWDGNIVEGAVAGIFWDIFDGTSSSDEPWGDYINQEFSRLWTVFLNDDPNDMQTYFWNGWQSRYGAGFNEWAIFYGSRINKDTTPPSQPTGFTSSHTPNVWSSDNTIDITWTGASDGLSGVWGYSYLWVNSPTQPDTTRDTTSNSFTSPPLSSGDWYCCIRTQDKAENWYTSYSWNVNPFKIDTTPPNNPTSCSCNPPVNVWSSDNSLDISWSGASDGHSGVNGYSYIFDQSPSTVPDATVDTTGTSLTVFLSDNIWYFHVRTRDNAGNWASGAYHCGPIKIDTTAPNNPTSYTSSHTANSWSADNTIDVTWYGASDGSGSGVNGYSYTWTTSPGLPDTTVDTTGTSVTSSPLSDGWWYLNIRTRDNVGNWNSWYVYCGPFGIDTGSPSNPNSYTSSHTIDVWSTDNTIDITWSGASDSLSGVYGYSFAWDQSPSTVPDTTQDTTGTSTTSPALSDGNNWYFHVRTRDNAGNWAGGAYHVGPFKIDANAPSNPTSYSSSHATSSWSTDSTIDVTWSGASDGSGSGVYGYSYSWTMSPELPDTSLETTGTSATSAPLSDGWWYLNIRTRDNAGNWNGGYFTCGPFGIDISAPSNPNSYSSSHTVNIWSNDNTIDISWSGASDGSGSGLNGYSLTWDQSPSTVPDTSVDTAGTSTTSSALSDGNSWYFHVRTKDNVGNWASSAYHVGPFKIDTATPSNPNSHTSGPPVNVWSTDNTVDIGWSGASDGSGSGVSGYSFAWDQSPSTVPDTTQDTTGTSTTSPALSDGNNWYFHVRTRDNAGNWAGGAYHVGPFKIDTTPPTTPSPDDGVTGPSSDNTPTFTWSCSDSGSGVAGYYWWVDSEPDNWITADSVTLPPQPDGSHTFYVVALDNAGNKGNSGQHDFEIETPTVWHFDFGTGSSPVESGYVQVTEATVYSGALGYGWDSTAGLFSRDRGAPDSLRRDLVQSTSDHTFLVDLLNGEYSVTLLIGDYSYMHDLIDVSAEGTLKVNDLTVPKGSFQEWSFTVTVGDGQLNLLFHDDGGTDGNWVINAITIGPPSPSFNVHLESVEIAEATSNMGSIIFDGISYGLPDDISKPGGTYMVSYAADGYVLDHWETSDGVSISGSIATVAGDGTLRAVYKVRPTKFDFGTSSSPVETGYVKVDQASLYSSSIGYGWSAVSGLYSRDRGLPDNLRRDLVQSVGDHTFNVDLSSGEYQVTLVVGDYGYTHDMIDVYAEGVLRVNDLTVPKGSFQEWSFTVTVGDGQLNLLFHDDGGTDGNWVINAITIGPPSPSFNVHLESVEIAEATSNMGSIIFDAVSYGLPNDISKPAGTYVVSYMADEYVLDHWETSDGVSISGSIATVAGDGTLRAVYKVRPTKFDFGTSSSPVEPGYVQVTEATVYSGSLGYGWLATSGLSSRDRGAPDNLGRDLVQSTTDHTFLVDLPNGEYSVTLLIGDYSYMHDLIDVSAEGTLKVNDLTVTKGLSQELPLTVTVGDGQLNLLFHDDGGTDDNWVINAITIELVS